MMDVLTKWLFFTVPIIVAIACIYEIFREEAIFLRIFTFFENLIPEKYIENCVNCQGIYDCNPRFLKIFKMRKCYKKFIMKNNKKM